MPVRVLLFGLPAMFLALTVWAAQQAKLNRAQRQGDLFVLVSDRELPQVHPYQPRSEASRQLTELIHQPLFKLDNRGQISAGLAQTWRWRKRMTVWFETEAAAADAEERLHSLRMSRWPAWGLEKTSRQGTQLRLIYDDPQSESLRETLQAAKARVLPVTLWRVTMVGNAKRLQTAFEILPTLKGITQRSWRDGLDAIELVTIQPHEDCEQRFNEAFRQEGFEDEAVIERRLQQPALEEPLLEVTLGEHFWHDGTRVSANDVKATFDALSQTAWPLLNRAGLDLVHRAEIVAPNRLHLALWRHYGPAMCAWVGLPVLPASWWEKHTLDPDGHIFLQSPPMGAGPGAVAHREANLLVLRAAPERTSTPRLSLVANLSGFNARLGFATQALDLAWPSTPVTMPIDSAKTATRRSPLRDLIQVHWNTRTELLADARVREALAAGVDRHELIKRALSGQGVAHGTFFAQRLWLSSALAPTGRDTDLAERRLTDAGWLHNVQGVATRPNMILEFELAVPSSDPVLMRVAAELRLQWLTLGVQTKVRVLSPIALKQAISTRKFDAVLSRSAPVTTWDLGRYWHSNGALNITGFSHRRVDLLIEALEQEFDPRRAANHTQQAEAIILSHHAVLPLLLTYETATLKKDILINKNEPTWILGNAFR